MAAIISAIDGGIKSIINDVPSKVSSVANAASSLINPPATKASSSTNPAAPKTSEIATTPTPSVTKTTDQKDKTQTRTSQPTTEPTDTEEPTSSSTRTSRPPTTLITSSTSTSSSLSSSSQPAASSIASATPAHLDSDQNSGSIPVAGIVVAALMGLLVFGSVLFLIFRYCPPVRRRVDAWQEKKRLARTYRDAIDGVPVPADKLMHESSPTSSFDRNMYSYSEQETNTRTPEVRSKGLGLGHRLSLLRQHSPFESDVPGQRQIVTRKPVPEARNRELPALPR